MSLYSRKRRFGVPISITGIPPGFHRVTILVTGRKGRPHGGRAVAVNDVTTPDQAEAEQRVDVDFAWQPNRAFEDVGRIGYVRSQLRDSDVRFTFRGTGVTWYTIKGRRQGQASVYIDGIRRMTVNNRARRRQLHLPIRIAGLSDAVHTLRIAAHGPRGRRFIAVDGWEVN